jgi:hypothetical protein
LIKISVRLLTVTTTGRGRTFKLNVLVLFCDKLSVAVIEKVVVVRTAEGVPLIAAVLESNKSPVGNTGPILNVTCPSPPVAVTGVNEAAVTPTVNVTEAVVAVVTIAAGRLTVNWNDLLLVLFWLSVAVTVNAVAVIVSVGVPEMPPVEILNVSPAGKLGLIENVVDPLPPEDVTGINGVISLPRVAVLVETANVVVNGGYVIVNA